MRELDALTSLATALGIQTQYMDGLNKPVAVSADTLMRVCSVAGAPLSAPRQAEEALKQWQATQASRLLPWVIVAWDGRLPVTAIPGERAGRATIHLEQGDDVTLERSSQNWRALPPLPLGYHRLTIEHRGREESATVIAAPLHAWRREDHPRSWGVGAQLAALRSARSRSVGDLQDLQTLCDWVREQGGNVATLLPLLPTFNQRDPECSPYSPVSRLFWSELILDLKHGHRPVATPDALDVTVADAEVRAALAGMPRPDPDVLDPELVHYATFRGVQARLGRNWRDWPANARHGQPEADQIDREEEHFHLVAQAMAREQLRDLRQRLDTDGFRLGLDLAVGVHPDGYDTWSRQSLFGHGMSVGAPPDLGFPSGQDWGFAPVLPEASRREGHRYLAASIAHQASLAGVLRIDHIMAWTRLYWIPQGMGLHEGTYVSYPAEELFAVLTLESVRHRCEIMGENLGNVPPEIDTALPRHHIWGLYLAQFAESPVAGVGDPTARDVALIGTHDTPTFAGWLVGNDIADRVRYRLLAADDLLPLVEGRVATVKRFAEYLGYTGDDRAEFLTEVLVWLGRSASPLVVTWLEDLWLEECAVNLPGTSSTLRPNWQRPMSRLLDDLMHDPELLGILQALQRARADAQR